MVMSPARISPDFVDPTAELTPMPGRDGPVELDPALVDGPVGVDDPTLVDGPVELDPALVMARARLLWPGLDRRQLGRTGGDPGRVTRLVSRRSALPPESIRAMLVGGE
jgi:hypothetical protein